MLYLRVERLAGAATQALQAHDLSTAARLSAELIAAVAELEALEKRARAL